MTDDVIRIIKSHNGHAVEFEDVIVEVWRDGVQWWGQVAWKRAPMRTERFTAADEQSAKDRCLQLAEKAEGNWQAGSYFRR